MMPAERTLLQFLLQLSLLIGVGTAVAYQFATAPEQRRFSRINRQRYHADRAVTEMGALRLLE